MQSMHAGRTQPVDRDDVVTLQPTGSSGGGALEGIRVIELGQLLAGPFAGHLLADMGAEVIKVEPPGRGDPMREWGHDRYKGRALFWPSLARNKMSVSLNLRSEAGQQLLKELVADADVLIENFRPGTLEKWGIGPDALLERNPRLVIARVSDRMREWGHDRYKGRALFWPSLARNKMSVSLNLRSEAGQQLLKELVADADVLIENFRPGTLEKWGIGPDALLERNPRLVIARV